MAEGARLESVYTETYREFESLSHRHIKKAPKIFGAFLCAKKIRTWFDRFAGSESGHLEKMARRAKYRKYFAIPTGLKHPANATQLCEPGFSF